VLLLPVLHLLRVLRLLPEPHLLRVLHLLPELQVLPELHHNRQVLNRSLLR
jgi:hypothetical protein